MHQANKLTDTAAQSITRLAIEWHKLHGRHDLPWQQAVSAYKVHVSEIMLQQTQVTTVIPYFERWMQRFPTLEALALASEDEVMHLWQGLGYYSRARNLRKAAQYLNEQHEGQYPNDLKALQAIPGVGRYTAGAIRSFAFNDYGPIVDGNVKRLYARLFGIYGDPTSSAVNKDLWHYAEALTPADASRTFSQGVLDLGATLCKRHTPLCADCPLQTHCFAFANDATAQLPSAKKKKTKPVRDGHFVWHEENQALLVVKRPSPGIWGGLWCLPEQSAAPANAELVGEFTHEFSHYRLQGRVWRSSELAEPAADYAQHQMQALHAISDIGLPTPIRQFIEDRQTLV
ncbi:A/G-specific adenine glycosylase [Aliidiomarina sp. Khilg15.8]